MANKRIAKDITTQSFEIYEDIHNIEITNKNLFNVLLSIKEKDVTSSFIFKIFGEFNGKNLCNPYDIMTIPPDIYNHNDQFVTTIGLWIFNKYFIGETNLFHVLGYINEPITSKKYKWINQKLSYAVIEDRITTSDLSRFYQKYIHMSSYEIILTPNHSEEMLSSTKKLNVKKKQLLKQYANELNSGDSNLIIKTTEMIEKELVDYTIEILGDDPSIDTFLSGAQGTLDNNFKNMFIMKGAIVDPITGDVKVLESNYADGVQANEYALFANSLAAGPYSRAKKTEVGGYWEKLFVAAFQHLTLDAPESDCGTKRFITVSLDEDNINEWMYNYIIEGSNLVELTSDNMSKYIGKTVKMRFSSMCESKTGFCNKCFGNLFYRINIKNVGVSSAQIPGKVKLVCMKQFHDSTIKTTTMDITRAFGTE